MATCPLLRRVIQSMFQAVRPTPAVKWLSVKWGEQPTPREALIRETPRGAASTTGWGERLWRPIACPVPWQYDKQTGSVYFGPSTAVGSPTAPNVAGNTLVTYQAWTPFPAGVWWTPGPDLWVSVRNPATIQTPAGSNKQFVEYSGGANRFAVTFSPDVAGGVLDGAKTVNINTRENPSNPADVRPARLAPCIVIAYDSRVPPTAGAFTVTVVVTTTLPSATTDTFTLVVDRATPQKFYTLICELPTPWDAERVVSISSTFYSPTSGVYNGCLQYEVVEFPRCGMLTDAATASALPTGFVRIPGGGSAPWAATEWETIPGLRAGAAAGAGVYNFGDKYSTEGYSPSATAPSIGMLGPIAPGIRRDTRMPGTAGQSSAFGIPYYYHLLTTFASHGDSFSRKSALRIPYGGDLWEYPCPGEGGRGVGLYYLVQSTAVPIDPTATFTPRIKRTSGGPGNMYYAKFASEVYPGTALKLLRGVTVRWKQYGGPAAESEQTLTLIRRSDYGRISIADIHAWQFQIARTALGLGALQACYIPEGGQSIVVVQSITVPPASPPGGYYGSTAVLFDVTETPPDGLGHYAVVVDSMGAGGGANYWTNQPNFYEAWALGEYDTPPIYDVPRTDGDIIPGGIKASWLRASRDSLVEETLSADTGNVTRSAAEAVTNAVRKTDAYIRFANNVPGWFRVVARPQGVTVTQAYFGGGGGYGVGPHDIITGAGLSAPAEVQTLHSWNWIDTPIKVLALPIPVDVVPNRIRHARGARVYSGFRDAGTVLDAFWTRYAPGLDGYGNSVQDLTKPLETYVTQGGSSDGRWSVDFEAQAITITAPTVPLGAWTDLRRHIPPKFNIGAPNEWQGKEERYAFGKFTASVAGTYKIEATASINVPSFLASDPARFWGTFYPSGLGVMCAKSATGWAKGAPVIQLMGGSTSTKYSAVSLGIAPTDGTAGTYRRTAYAIPSVLSELVLISGKDAFVGTPWEGKGGMVAEAVPRSGAGSGDGGVEWRYYEADELRTEWALLPGGTLPSRYTKQGVDWNADPVTASITMALKAGDVVTFRAFVPNGPDWSLMPDWQGRGVPDDVGTVSFPLWTKQQVRVTLPPP